MLRGKTRMEALRCLKRRLSDVVYRHLLADATTITSDPDEQLGASPGGHLGAALKSSAVDSHPNIDAPPTHPLTEGTRCGRSGANWEVTDRGGVNFADGWADVKTRDFGC